MPERPFYRAIRHGCDPLSFSFADVMQNHMNASIPRAADLNRLQVKYRSPILIQDLR